MKQTKLENIKIGESFIFYNVNAGDGYKGIYCVRKLIGGAFHCFKRLKTTCGYIGKFKYSETRENHRFYSFMDKTNTGIFFSLSDEEVQMLLITESI